MLCVLLYSPAHAAVLLSESFDYTNGPLTVVSGGAWAMHSGSTPQQVDVSGSRVNLTGSESEDVNRLLAGQPYLAGGTTNIFYARFVARFTALPSTGGEWFASFKSTSATGFRGRVFALTTGAAPGQFRLGLSSGDNDAPTVTNQTDLSLNTPFTVVLRFANTNSASSLWLNPSSENDPALTTTEAAAAFTVAALALRQNSGIGTLTIDELVVGTAFADVISVSSPVAPFLSAVPQSQVIARGSNVTFIAAATGTAPLLYQWLFNDAAIPGATNTSFSLTNLSLAQQGDYRIVVTNLAGATTSAPAALNITVTASTNGPAAFTLLTYNVKGNSIADWSTNSPQVQAIGRQVQFLDPDIITFQEIPNTNNGMSQMTNFVIAFRPGFFLATNSGTDNFIRSVILSRFPITRSTKRLDGVFLGSFGYSGFFTRDLFEAEIAVPGWPLPLHVFTTHLKSGQDNDSTLKRGAETRAISNFFAHGFLLTNALRPYLLTGDFNEDVNDPPNDGTALPTLTSAPTGLRLITPLNPITGSARTFNIRSLPLDSRYDYVLPCALLLTNVLSGEIFRTDLVTNISPALPGDAATASDHLPLFLRFANPFAVPPRILSFGVSNAVGELNWSAVPGGRYRLEASTNLPAWTPLATNLLATNGVVSFSTNASGTMRFFRVRIEP